MTSTRVIALLGGTFNPPHQGHIKAALDTLTELGISRLGLMPCKLPPHKTSDIVSEQQRSHMVELAAKQDARLYIENIELRLPPPSFTVNTLRVLRRQYPNQSLCFFMGDDSLHTITSWREWERLLDYTHIIVMSRKSAVGKMPHVIESWLNDNITDDPNMIKSKPHGKIYISQSNEYPVSSSQLRQQLCRVASQQDQECLQRWLHADVLHYIKQHELYGSSTD